LYEMPPGAIAAMAGLVLALGITYWLIRERDASERHVSERERAV
jgi:hypothetical protein